MSAQTTARLAQLIAVVCPIDGVSVGAAGDPLTVQISFSAAATAPQRASAQAVVDGFDWSAIAGATYDAQQAKADATNAIDYGALQRGTVSERLIRALALVVLDEINLLRTNAALSKRTQAQLVNAIKAKIAETGE